MNLHRAVRGALPPLLVGAALAVVAEVAVGLLLYSGPDFVRALSVVLAVLLASLAVGIRSGGRSGGRSHVDEARRRWLLVLVSVGMAAVFAALWEGFRGFGASGVSQGIGLGVLAALPMYAGGRLVGSFPDGGGTALAGGAVGVLAAGYLLLPALSPTVILLLCLTGLSGGALLHGRALEREAAAEPDDPRPAEVPEASDAPGPPF